MANLGVTMFPWLFAPLLAPLKAAQQVLIELQKSNSGFDIRRFRRYLAENYHEASPSEVSSKTNAERDRDNPVLTILSIYLLGFPLTEPNGHILTFGAIAFEAWKKLLFFSVREHETGLVNLFL